MKQHPKLQLRYGEKLPYHRAIADIINRYFDLLEETLKSNNFFESPMLIFNCDESGFPLQHKPAKIIGVQGQRDISCITSCDKAQITVFSACSASGYLLPPRYDNGYHLPDIRYKKWTKLFHPKNYL